MKKKTKTICIFVASIFIILGLYVVGLVTRIIPNPFFDNADLVCEKEFKTSGTSNGIINKKREKITFDFWGRIKEWKRGNIIITNSEKDISNIEKRASEIYEADRILKDKNTIIYEKNVDLNDKNLDKTLSRKDIKKTYERIKYDCN